MPVVVLAARGGPVGLLHEHLRGDAWADRDRLEHGRVRLARRVQLVQADVRTCVLEARGEVLWREDGAREPRGVGDRGEVRRGDYEDEGSKPEGERGCAGGRGAQARKPCLL